MAKRKIPKNYIVQVIDNIAARIQALEVTFSYYLEMENKGKELEKYMEKKGKESQDGNADTDKK